MAGSVTTRLSSSPGFSLVETMVSLGVLMVGLLGAAAALTAGMRHLSSSPADVIVTQKAAQAIEAVFAARDSGKLTWSQIKNASAGGVFLDGEQPLKLAGADGVVNTADDGAVESMAMPGADRVLGTADDVTVTLSTYTRQITITDVPNENGQLRSIVVTMRYHDGPRHRTYVLTSFISAYS